MDKLLDLFLLFLTQFAGGPGPTENNLVRFGLPAVLWAGLFYLAWNRQRAHDLPREKLLVWGFGLAFVRETYMFGQMVFRLLFAGADAKCEVIQPLEHGLAMAAMIVVAAAFLRYSLEEQRISRVYLQAGIGVTLLAFILTSWAWPRQLAESPMIKFHQTWAAWLFHIPLSIFMGVAVFLLYRKRGWLPMVVGSALAFDLVSELLLLANYATDRAYNAIICPIGNSLHIFAIPLLGYIYLREQAMEKKQAEDALMAYRDRLEQLVHARTAELTTVNTQLKQEVFERSQAEQALERLTHRYELILESAGEGICGIDLQGRIIFTNSAAAQMLGYSVEELVNRPCYEIWHPQAHQPGAHAWQDCPISQSYSQGIQRFGDDEVFWRRDGTDFPVRYISNPIQEKDQLFGAVLVFRDITERKRNEAEIAQRNASLATQNAIAALLSQSLDIDHNLRPVLEMARVEAGMAIGLIYLVEAARSDLKLKCYSGPETLADQSLFGRANSLYYQLSRRAVLEKKVITASVTETEKESGASPLPAELMGMHSLVSVPIASKGRAVGVITLGTLQQADIQLHILDFLTAIGQQIGLAIENARLYRDIESWAGELARLQQASSSLASSLDHDQVTNEIARQSAWLLKCQKSCVIRLNTAAKQLELAASFGLSQDEIQTLQAQLPQLQTLVELASRGDPVTIQNAAKDRRLPPAVQKKLRIKAALLAPIWISETPREFIFVLEGRAVRQWRRQDLELIENLASRGALALVNASLHHQTELAAALEERQRIAANMHDGLAQTISFLGLRVDKLEELLDHHSDPGTLGVLREIQDVVAHASIEVRRSIASLQQESQPRRSLQSFLQELCAELQTPAGASLGFEPTLRQPLYLPSSQMEQLLMIVREAILNAARHAQAHSIHTLLDACDGTFRLVIKDDGRGFDLDASLQNENHFGLSIMKARAARIGGSLQIDTSPGNGTQVQITWSAQLAQDQAPLNVRVPRLLESQVSEV